MKSRSILFAAVPFVLFTGACASPTQEDDDDDTSSSESRATPAAVTRIANFRQEGGACISPARPAHTNADGKKVPALPALGPTFRVSPDKQAATAVFSGTPLGTCKMSFDVTVPAGTQITVPRVDVRGRLLPTGANARGTASGKVAFAGGAAMTWSKSLTAQADEFVGTTAKNTHWSPCAKAGATLHVTTEFTTTATNALLPIDTVDWELSTPNAVATRKCP